MRCARCMQTINPARAYTDQGRNFGPVCAMRLGLTKPAKPRQAKRFAMAASVAVRVDDGQMDIFEAMP